MYLRFEWSLGLAQRKVVCCDGKRKEGLKVFCDGKRWVYAAPAARQSLLFTLVDCFPDNPRIALAFFVVMDTFILAIKVHNIILTAVMSSETTLT